LIIAIDLFYHTTKVKRPIGVLILQIGALNNPDKDGR